MRRHAVLAGVAILLALAGAFAAIATTNAEPTVETRTFTHEDVVTYTVPTVTETVVVTETAPPSPPPPEPPPPPPPSGNIIIRDGTNWTCMGSVDLDLVKVTNPGGTLDALRLGQNCTGIIRRIELSGPMADGIKVLNAGTVAHDLVIGGGYVFCGRAEGGVHQDGIQAMGGRNVAMSNLVIDCLGGGGGNYFIAQGGSGASTPTNYVCDHCAFGPRHPNQIRTPSGTGNGVRNSLVCQSLSGRQTYSPAAADMGGNVEPEPTDPRCTPDGLRAYVGG